MSSHFILQTDIFPQSIRGLTGTAKCRLRFSTLDFGHLIQLVYATALVRDLIHFIHLTFAPA